MPAKHDENQPYKLTISGDGLNLRQPVSRAVAGQVLALVMGTSKESGSTPPELPPPATPGARDTSKPKAFMAAKQPKTDIERMACLAYFLTHHRNQPTFRTSDLRKMNIDAAGPRLSNPSVAARNAVNQGYLSLAGGGRKQLAVRGEAVVLALPNRASVKTALDQHPIRKRRARRKSTK